MQLDIHFIDGEYYNYNGKNPEKPLSKPYGKRLYNDQLKYGNISIKEARGHGKLSKKKDEYIKLKIEDNTQLRRDTVVKIHKINEKDFLDKGFNPLDFRTRFRSGFKVYEDEFKYDSFVFHKAMDGIIPMERFLNQLPNDIFGRDNVFGGFRYVVYNKKSRNVYLHYEYGEQT